MLARALPGVPVLVGARSLSVGPSRRAAARRHGALLDDGFQHLELARDVDLLLVAEDDLQRSAAAGRPAARAARRGARAPTPRSSPPATTRRPSASAARFGVAHGVPRDARDRRAAHGRRRARLGRRAVELARVRRRRHRAARSASSPTSRRPAGTSPARWRSAITIASRRATSRASPRRAQAAARRSC